jgi:hypothetical protein
MLLWIVAAASLLVAGLLVRPKNAGELLGAFVLIGFGGAVLSFRKEWSKFCLMLLFGRLHSESVAQVMAVLYGLCRRS